MGAEHDYGISSGAKAGLLKGELVQQNRIPIIGFKISHEMLEENLRRRSGYDVIFELRDISQKFDEAIGKFHDAEILRETVPSYAFFLGAEEVLRNFAYIKADLGGQLGKMEPQSMDQSMEIFSDSFKSEEAAALSGIPNEQECLVLNLTAAQEVHEFPADSGGNEGFSRGAVAMYKTLEFLWPKLYPKVR